ncbi:receptor-like protein EIX1 [Pistacia vera]|uniref:receptor-like protein EIX1 n=1 Tax=Pistacia vera TaxID=55513 RepID=UPI001263B83D|nr:receptor-like protein EIX1 [Pistacia vera]
MAMSGGRFLQHLLLAVLILFLFQQRVADSDVMSCRDDEREALLVFKQGLVGDDGFLSSWGSEDDKKNCCEWRGIQCRQTGHVQRLELRGTRDLNAPLEGKLNASLLKLHHLSHLDLSYNYFSGSPIPESIASLTKLTHLGLSNAGFKGQIPYRLGNLSRLQLLDLSGNDGLYNAGNIEWLSHLSSLRYLDLSGSDLRESNDWFQVINKLPFLTELSVVWCNLPQIMPWAPLKVNATASFVSLDLTGNHVTNSIYPWLFNVSSNLNQLSLDFNLLHGSIPEAFGNYMTSLTSLSLKSNDVEGGFPKCIGNMSCLDTLELSSNNLTGQLSGFFKNLSGGCTEKKLEFLYLWGSSSFICSAFAEYLTYLDLSNNLLSGMLPDCWIKFEELVVLNVASNGFSGKIPPSMGSLGSIVTLRLSNNNFFGELPILSNCTRLRILDLQDNALSGKIPEWIGERLPSLLVLSLESNKLNGSIPFQLCRLANIQILDLSLNSISGNIPPCFNNFTALSEERSSHAAITYEFDFNLYGEIHYVDSAWLTWKGSKYEYKNTLGLVKSLDLSDNKLDGTVPEEIMSLVGLIALNLSKNNFSGTIPPKIGQLKSLDFLDLSRNRFSGEIPSSLSLINRLSVMDLSDNNFSGKIPTGTQLQSFNASVYAGNPELCGLPLPKKCLGEEPTQGPATIDIPEDEIITLGFYISLALGFIAGFWGVCGSLVLSQSWRHAYFNFLADIKDKIYVIATINFAKLKQSEAFTEDDWKLVQLVETLFRNVLAVQDIPLQQKAGGSASQFISLRDGFLELLLNENVMDIILVITLHVGGSSGSFDGISCFYWKFFITYL